MFASKEQVELTYHELEERAKKKEWWCWSQWFWHWVALPPTRWLLYTKVTANQVTVFWVLLQFVAAYMMLGNYWRQVAGIVLYNFVITILDCVDGNLARARQKESYVGIYLEQVGMFLGTPLIISALSYQVFLATDQILYLYLGGIGSLLFLYSRLFNPNPVWFGQEKQDLMTQIYSAGSFRQKRSLFGYVANIFRRGQPFNLLFFGVLLNQLEMVIIGYFASFVFEAFRKLFVTTRMLQQAVKK